MKQKKYKKTAALVAALLWSLLCLGACLLLPVEEAADDYDVKLHACTLLAQWEQEILQKKQLLGIPVDTEDTFRSGLIGEDYTELTTTYGALEAKRTTTDPMMAALVVQLLREAGMHSGGRIGAGFSGSFPGLNLAVLAACEAMGIEIVYIASVGASTYGANQPGMTFPDMARFLLESDLLQTAPAGITPGGQDDMGYDMDPDLLAQALDRAAAAGFPLLLEPDYVSNLAARMDAYGAIDCFVGVGGNLTTVGPGEKSVPFGVILPGTLSADTPDDGLVQKYNASGLPVVHLLNVRRLVTDYGMEYDPQVRKAPGTGPLFLSRSYAKTYALAGIAGALLLLGLGTGRKTKQEEWPWPGEENTIG